MDGVIKLKNNKQKLTRYSRKIGRMGNSLGVSLPKQLAERLDVSQGDEVEFIENERGEVILKKFSKRNFLTMSARKCWRRFLTYSIKIEEYSMI